MKKTSKVKKNLIQNVFDRGVAEQSREPMCLIFFWHQPKLPKRMLENRNNKK